MNNKIIEIIQYYTTHEVTKSTQERVFNRLSSPTVDEEADEAFRALWNDEDAQQMDEAEVDAAYERLMGDNGNIELTSHQVRLPIWIRVAAVVIPLLMIVAFSVVYAEMNGRLKSYENVSMIRQVCDKGKERSIVLTDGTKVTLIGNSILLYPSKFVQGEREVYLVGEAFFDVKHDDNHPFNVITSCFEITDLGTSFGVSSSMDNDEATTAVLSGKVSLRVSGSQETYLLHPKDCFVYNKITGERRLEKVNNLTPDNWNVPEVTIDDVTITEAMRIMERAYGVKIVLRSNKFARARITVRFNRGETLDNAMEVIATLIPGFDYKIAGNTVIVR